MAKDNKVFTMKLPDKAAQQLIKQAKGQEVVGSIKEYQYPKSTTCNYPITKSAQFAGSGASVIHTQPMFFSPMHTPQSWQIASKRREVYQWLATTNLEVIANDYTLKSISNLSFSRDNLIEDTLTEGILYDDIKSENILNPRGGMTSPSRYAVRECFEKRCFSFKATGYWRGCEVSEEHPMIVIDGKKYRHKVKLEQGAEYRNKKGIKKEGCKPNIKYEENLVCRKEAKDVDVKDFLLCPIPELGIKSENKNKSWLVGLAIADGYLDHKNSTGPYYTLSKDEYHLPEIGICLQKEFEGKVGTRKHGEGKGYRIGISTKNTYKFFSSYIKNKGTKKKFAKKTFELDKESRLHILGGYFDGDGSFNKTSHKLIANNYSKDMADQLYFMLLSVGISCSLNKVPLYGDHYRTDSEWCYRIIIPSSEATKLQPYMRSNKIPEDFEPKKIRNLRFFYKDYDGTLFFAQPIEYKKEFLYTGPGYDIQMDPDRAFVGSGYVISNCRFYYENEPKVAAAVDFYCFVPKTPILMSDGKQKPISSIRVGDKVRCHDGSINSVTRTFEREADEDVIKIYVAGLLNGPLVSSFTHKILTERNDNIEYVHASEIKEEDVVLTPCSYLGDIKENIPKNRNALGYLLGAYAAEGCEIPYEHISKRGRKVSDRKGARFHLNLNEEFTYGNAIIDCATKLYGKSRITIIRIEDKSTLLINVYGKFASDDICGMCPGTSSDGTKRFAPHVMNYSEEFLSSLLAGFFDGDGSLSRNMGQQAVGVCYHLMSQIRDIVAGLGLEYAYEERIPSEKNRQKVKVVRLPSRVAGIFDKIAAKPSDWPEPKTRFQNNITFKRKGKYIARKVRKVKIERYVGNLFDIEVENHHSYVANCISCSNSQFPINNFKLECKSTKIRKFYERLVKRLKLNTWFQRISHEYFLLGDVFVFLDIQCPNCDGTGVGEDGQICNHPEGTFNRIMVLNPDWVEVHNNQLADEPLIVLLPDEELKMVVEKQQPKHIYDRLPDSVKQMVLMGRPIPLSNRSVSHIKLAGAPYGTYGDSLLRRLFTVLAYKTKLMTANWIIAERLILPVRVVKIGDEKRPATAEDINDTSNQLAAVANDPNLTIVTHHAFDYSWFGATGKIHNITSEIEQIGKEILDGVMLNQALLNGEMCIPEEDMTLTRDGFKYIDEITEDDEIATFNMENECIEYQKYTYKHIYEFSGDIINFRTNKIDFACTANHNMLVQKRDKEDWEIIKASEVTQRMKFRKNISWEGEHIDNVEVAGTSLSIDQYLCLAAYYITEGSIMRETRASRKRYKKATSINIGQIEKGKGYSEVSELFEDLPWNYCHSDKYPYWIISNYRLAENFESEFGSGSYNKKCSNFIKNLNVDDLKVFLKYLINGDGSIRNINIHNYYTYYTRSKKLCYDVMEICIKCGYWPRMNYFKDRGYEVLFSDNNLKSNTLPLESKKYNEVNSICYTGRVYCFTVPNHTIITMRNGRITISGNSGYANAQVGVETMIRRLQAWRDELAEWAEENIFLPVAQMQGFIDKEETEEGDEDVFIYPKIRWNDLQLRDKTNELQMYMQMYDKQLVSAHFFLDKFDIDYDQMIKEIREEQMTIGANGMVGGMGGPAGGMPPGGGMGGLGGDMMGGDMMGGDMMGGAPMGGGMMGGAPMGGAPMGVGASNEEPLKVYKKGKAPKAQEQEEAPRPQIIKLTSPEKKMFNALSSMKIPYQLYAQFKVPIPGNTQPYSMDFAYPNVGVDIECLHPEQLVLTPKGEKKAKDVTESDVLIGRDSSGVSIEKIFHNKYEGQLFSIKTKGMSPIRVTDNHPILVSKLLGKNDFTKLEFIDASKIDIGDRVVIPQKVWTEGNIKDKRKIKVDYIDEDFVYIKVISIKNIKYNGDVINFETKGKGDANHTYIVGYIVTHNCDGDKWHTNDEDKAHDKERDVKLAQRGWTVLRFTETAIDEHMDQVQKIIYDNLTEVSKAKRNKSKKVNSSKELKDIKYGTLTQKTEYGFITKSKLDE